MIMEKDVRIEFGNERLLSALCAGFNTGFVDYKYGIQMDEPQMVKFLAHSGIDLEHSAVLLQRNDDGWQGVGVALVAIDDDKAWCSGLAVAPALRKRGLGRWLMETIQCRAAAVGARTLQLEVLVHNSPARRLYAMLGYQPVRNLLFWSVEPSAPLQAAEVDLYAANVDEALDAAHRWQRESPAWQRTQYAVARYRQELWAYKMQDRQGVSGWVICLPTTPQETSRPRMRLMMLAVRPGDDAAVRARQLLASLRAHRPDTVISIINEPEESIFTPALQATGFREIDRQIEMVLRLR